MNDFEAILLLSQIPGFSTAKLRALMTQKIAPADFVRHPRSFREFGFDFLTNEFLESFQKTQSEIDVSKIQNQCARMGIQILSYLDSNYPELLKEIYNPPLVLYVKGNLIPEDKAAIAVVGSRHASAYGMRVAHRISYELAEAGVTIVSGLARGIDAEAHRGAMDARGRTIAILGSGIDVIYPKEHEKLYAEISESGAVVSEFPFGAPPIASHFPVRNRIIAGLSLGTLVVEAHHRSGSLITASLTLEAGREVYAVPGAIDSLNSRGTNGLIKEGAKLVTASDDILEDLQPVLRHYVLEEKSVKSETLPECDHISDAEETKFLGFFDDGALSFDEIQTESHLSSEQIYSMLVRLELKKWITRKPGGFYEMNVQTAKGLS